MVFLGLEQPVAYGREQVFDPTTAQMVLNANKDYINAVYRDYQQAMADMKEFNEKYGDFTSPIQADMDWYYNNVTGRVKNFINDLYARGIDPLRSQEGRAAIARELATMPTKGIADVRQSAEIAKEYVKAAGQLAAEGRYDPDAERFFGRDLSTWSTMGDQANGIKARGIWGASSPVKSQTMDEIIEPVIKNLDYMYDADRTRQANDGHDYYTVTEDRIRQTIADSMPDLVRSGTMGGYYYNKALQASENDPEKALQLYTNWLVDRGKDHLREKKEVNQYKMLATKNEMDRQNMLLQDKLARDREALKFQYQAALKGMGGSKGANGGSKYGSVTGNTAYNLPEEIHHDGLYTAIQSSGVPVYKLIEDGNGNLVPAAKGPNGSFIPAKSSKDYITINPDDAAWEELEFAANRGLTDKQIEFATKQAGNRPYSFIFDNQVQNNYLNQYGYHINGLEVGSLFPTKKIDKDGSIILSSSDIKNLRKLSGIIADSKGSRAKYSRDNMLKDVLPSDGEGPNRKGTAESDFVYDQIDKGQRVQASFVFDDSSDKNIMQLIGDDDETQVWVKGNVTYITGANAGKQTPMHTTQDVWLPTNIKSNKSLYQKFSTSNPWQGNFGLNSKYRNAYDAMAAHYAKITGSQKNTNVALGGSDFDSDDDDLTWPLFYKQ